MSNVPALPSPVSEPNEYPGTPGLASTSLSWQAASETSTRGAGCCASNHEPADWCLAHYLRFSQGAIR